MTTQYDYGRRNRGGGFYTMLLVLLLGATCLGVFVHQARAGFAGRLAAMITGRPLNVLSAPMVVDKVQRLNRLESVVYSLDTVVEGDAAKSLPLPDALTGDKILMVVHGDTIAGVDMSQLKPDDVQITEGNGRSIKLVLPPSQVFVTTIDNAHTRVYARDTGLLVSADPNLESVTRAKAQQELQQAALADGILDAAAKNARATVTAMLEGLGFEHVEVK
jgi:Protein of unknown function (DUF4230)